MLSEEFIDGFCLLIIVIGIFVLVSSYDEIRKTKSSKLEEMKHKFIFPEFIDD